MGILLAVSGGFATGVLLRSLFVFGWSPIVFALLLAALCTGARAVVPRLAYSLGAVFFLFAAFGMFRAILSETPLPQSFAAHLKQRVAYDGTVVADPDVRDATQRTEVRVTNGKDSTIMLVVAPRRETVAVGDQVHVSGTLLLPEPFQGDNGRTFQYDKYLERDGIRFLLDYASIRVTTPAPWYSVSALLARIKHVFLDGLNAALPEPYSSLAGGIVIGGKSGLGTDLQDAFTKSGLIQIIVLSGYNIMVVAEWIMAALAYTKLRREWTAVMGALAVVLFVGIAGTSATALRAMLMAFIALYARATGKSYTAGRALLVVVFLMLLYNPLYLAFDPGFDLSVVATAGLIWIAPIIETYIVSAWRRFLGSRLAPRHPRAPSGASGFEQSAPQESSPERMHNGFWVNAFATTLAAQTAVLPLLLYFTGNLSLIAIPANLIVDPFVPLAMGFSALAGFAGMLFAHIAPVLGYALAFPSYLATLGMIFVATKAASLPAAAFTISMFPWWAVAFSYATLVFIASSKRFSTTDQLRLAKNAST